MSRRSRWKTLGPIIDALGGEVFVSSSSMFWSYARRATLEERTKWHAAVLVTPLAGRPPGIVRAFGCFFVRVPNWDGPHPRLRHDDPPMGVAPALWPKP